MVKDIHRIRRRRRNRERLARPRIGNNDQKRLVAAAPKQRHLETAALAKSEIDHAIHTLTLVRRRSQTQRSFGQTKPNLPPARTRLTSLSVIRPATPMQELQELPGEREKQTRSHRPQGIRAAGSAAASS